MANLAICRVCLTADLKTHSIRGTQLQNIYEKLTNSKLSHNGRPQTVCYICLWQLQRCRKLQNKAEKSEEILKQLLHNGIEISQRTVAVLNNGIPHNFSTTPVESMSYNYSNGTIKEEPTDIKQETTVEEYCEESCETAVCRVCLSGRHKGRAIKNTSLQVVYEKLTNYKPSVDCRPAVLCHICRALLQRCRALMNKAIKADRILSELIYNNIQLTRETASMLNRRIKPALSVRSVELTNYYAAEDLYIKQENENGNRTENPFQNDLMETPLEEIKSEIPLNKLIVKSEEYGYVIQNYSQTYSQHELFRQRKIVQVYSCDHCFYQCYDTTKLENHRKFHDQKREYACQICKYRYKTQNGLNAHKKRMHSIKLNCTICNETFSRKLQFKMHKLIHTEKTIYKCELCNVVYNQRSYIVDHISKIHPQERYPCERCNKVYTKPQWLRDHMFRIHAVQSRRYICDICHKDFAVKSSLKLHISNAHDEKKPHKCSECPKEYSTRQHLKTHMSIHTGEKPYKCDICNKSFREQLFLKKHKETHGEKLIPCNECGIKFLRNGSLKDHIKRIHTKERPFGCNKCSASFVNRFVLKNHMATHSKARPYMCTHCQKSFKTKCTLRNHTALNHSGREQRIYICDLCTRVFNKKSNLTKHLNFHYGNKPFGCDLCDRYFSIKCSMVAHRRTHTREKPYSCNICERKFRQYGALRRHNRVHTGEKPYVCNKCHIKYPDKASLTRHQANVHNEVVKYICDLCNKVFIEKAVLAHHLRHHNLETPYSCDKCKLSFNKLTKLTLHSKIHIEKACVCNFCGKTFVSRSNLIRHNIIAHSGVRAFACNICEQPFDRLLRLNSHIRRHTGEKAFSCEICDRPYVERRDLQQHMKTKHKTVLVFR